MRKLQKREQHIPRVNQNNHGGIKEQQQERRDELTDSTVFWYTPRSGGHGLVIIIEGAVTMHGRREGLANDVNGFRYVVFGLCWQ